MKNSIYFGDNLPIIQKLPKESIDLVYIDPPFNTGKVQRRTQLEVERVDDGSGNRTGFNGNSYRSLEIGTRTFNDFFDDFMKFLEPRLYAAYQALAAHGSLYFHIDYREVHYCKLLLDSIFGRHCFLNEIIWAYDYGGKSNRKWPAKHDNILVYVKDPEHYYFNDDEVERIPYMAPELVGPEKAARGKRITDTWWHTIVPTNGYEKTGYPTQKPLGIVKRIVQASSKRGDLVLDFFAGSGTTGAACLELERQFILVDSNQQAIDVMKQRFAHVPSIVWFDQPE